VEGKLLTLSQGLRQEAWGSIEAFRRSLQHAVLLPAFRKMQARAQPYMPACAHDNHHVGDVALLHEDNLQSLRNDIVLRSFKVHDGMQV
jgi:hypothetical protein